MDARIKEFRKIYEEMDDNGREKMALVLEEYRRKPAMSEQEINMWSVLISVLKNWGRRYDEVLQILPDICDVQEFIKTGNIRR